MFELIDGNVAAGDLTHDADHVGIGIARIEFLESHDDDVGLVMDELFELI